MVKYLYHGESDSYFISPAWDAERHISVWDCSDLDYYEWVVNKIKDIETNPYIGGAYVCMGIAAYLQKYSIPQGFTTFDYDTFWYVRIDGECMPITLSKYDDYWQAQILDVIFPFINFMEL